MYKSQRIKVDNINIDNIYLMTKLIYRNIGFIKNIHYVVGRGFFADKSCESGNIKIYLEKILIVK